MADDDEATEQPSPNKHPRTEEEVELEKDDQCCIGLTALMYARFSSPQVLGKCK
jgi:hypothetical protein